MKVLVSSTLAALVVAVPALAGDGIVVTATRFADTALRVPANVSLITREDIRAAAVDDLPSLLKHSAGINIRALYGNHGIDATVDLRGFGESGGNNTLVLVDGQRMNPVDGGSIAWSSIPLDAIERIEILRGQGTVLYGDRASAGVINIITDKATRPRAAVGTGAGSFGGRSANAHFSQTFGAAYMNFFAHHAETDGYRQNSQSDQNTLSGRFGVRRANHEGFVDFAFYRDSTGLPGALFSTAYRNDRKSARFLNDTQRRSGYRLRPGAAVEITPSVTAEFEVGVEHDELAGDFVSQAMTSQRDRNTISLTPRLRVRHGAATETVLGFDFYQGDVKADFSSGISQTARQQSKAAYFQTTAEVAPRWSVNVGGRVQRMDQDVAQAPYLDFFGMPVPALEGSADTLRRAFELGLTYQGEGWRGFAKTGRTVRFASTDELFGYDPMTFLPVFAGNLRPQRGQLSELGLAAGGANWSLRGSLYRQTLVDELGYDGRIFSNVNFDPTERRGIETEAVWKLMPTLKAQFNYTLTEARFREGPDADRTLPLVPRHQAGVQLDWAPQAMQSYKLSAQRTGAQILSGDFTNTLGEMSGWTTVDAAATWQFKPATVTLRVTNLTDKHYASYGGYSTFSNDYYYYPAEGRAVSLSLRHDFR